MHEPHVGHDDAIGVGLEHGEPFRALAETPILISAAAGPTRGDIGVGGSLKDVRPVRPAVSGLADARCPGPRVGTGHVGDSNIVFGHTDERWGLAGRKIRGEVRPVRVAHIQPIHADGGGPVQLAA